MEEEFNLKDSILRIFGAMGISVKSEVAKNEIRLRASKLAGTSMALSFTVSNKWRRLTCHPEFESIHLFIISGYQSHSNICRNTIICVHTHINSLCKFINIQFYYPLEYLCIVTTWSNLLRRCSGISKRLWCSSLWVFWMVFIDLIHEEIKWIISNGVWSDALQAEWWITFLIASDISKSTCHSLSYFYSH